MLLLALLERPSEKFGGQFSSISAVELGTAAAKSAIQKGNIDPTLIDTVIFGQVLQAGLGQNPARQVALNSGLSHTSTALTVKRSLWFWINRFY